MLVFRVDVEGREDGAVVAWWWSGRWQGGWWWHWWSEVAVVGRKSSRIWCNEVKRKVVRQMVTNRRWIVMDRLDLLPWPLTLG